MKNFNAETAMIDLRNSWREALGASIALRKATNQFTYGSPEYVAIDELYDAADEREAGVWELLRTCYDVTDLDINKAI